MPEYADALLKEILTQTRTIALVGAYRQSREAQLPGRSVPDREGL